MAKEISKITKTVTEITRPRLEPGLTNKALAIISKESGIAVQDLTDDCNFDDIGMDSLSCLMVSSRLNDELGINLESSRFLEFVTVTDLKSYLESVFVVNTHIEEDVVTESQIVMTEVVLWNKILDVISKESGVVVRDLTNDTFFSDIGIDSLLSLVIWSRLQDELSLEVENITPFLEFHTIGGFKTFIMGKITPGESVCKDSVCSPQSSKSSSLVQSPLYTPGDTTVLSPDSEVSAEAIDLEMQRQTVADSLSLIPAWSLILQGNVKQATKVLFLFPDGCGAATSYMRIPRLSPSIAVVGFNSPFMK